MLKNYLGTLDNWDTGNYREIELKGHSQNVLCVCLEARRLHSRLASGILLSIIVQYNTVLFYSLLYIRATYTDTMLFYEALSW